MNIKVIENDQDLQQAFKQLEPIFQASEGTIEAENRDALMTLIEIYENEHYPI